MKMMRLKLRVQGDDRAELEDEASKMASDFFGHDRFELVMWEVSPVELGAGGSKFAELLGVPFKKYKATVTASERRSRPSSFVDDEEEDDED